MRSQMLLHRRRRELPLQLLDERRDVERPHVGELVQALRLAPGREAARGVQVRLAGVVVVDLRGEEFDEALRRLRRRREQRGRKQAGRWGKDKVGAHGNRPPSVRKSRTVVIRVPWKIPSPSRSRLSPVTRKSAAPAAAIASR